MFVYMTAVYNNLLLILLLFNVYGFVHAVLYAPQVFMLWMKTEWRCDVPEWVHI